MIQIPLWVAVLIALTTIVLVVLLWSVKRRQDVRLHVSDPGELGAMINSIAGLAHGSVIDGNRIEVVQNGAFFERMLEDVKNAKSSVHFETYVWWKGEITDRVATTLSEKAEEGVVVRVLMDAMGSTRMEDRQFEQMERAGCKVAKFHPYRISNLGRLNNRDHRKIVIVDGQIGWVSGHGIAQEWTGDAQDKEHWRDTAIRIEGPVVTTLQSVFSENWIEETGEVFAGDQYFRELEPVGRTPAHVAYSSPAGSVSSVELLHLLAIAAARKRVLIQNPYFLPDPQDIKVFAEAVARGVDVMVMMPSDDATDAAIVQHASHHRFGALLESGVRIFEYDKTGLHQKVIVVDGIWSSVGSTNFDDRSFELNDEISVGILDPAIAAELEQAWQRDMEYAEEWSLEQWKSRSIRHKLTDFFAFLLNEQL